MACLGSPFCSPPRPGLPAPLQLLQRATQSGQGGFADLRESLALLGKVMTVHASLRDEGLYAIMAEVGGGGTGDGDGDGL